MWTLPLRMLQQVLAAPTLARIPEPEPIMVGAERCATYASAGQARNLQAVFDFCLDVIASSGVKQGRALDLGCGTGQLLVELADAFPGLELTGLDASPDMLELSRQRLSARDDGARFQLELGDLRALSRLPPHHFHLTTWTMTAHHLDSLEEVGSVLEQLARITHPEGLVLVLDLGRLKTRSLNEWYIGWAGRHYTPELLEEFRVSMNAAFRADELKQVLQRPPLQQLVHITPFGLPTLQFLLRVPSRDGKTGLKALTPRPTQQERPLKQVPEVAQDYQTLKRLFQLRGL